MRKHEEVLKLFAFILNLFDKYKYAIKLILYLLKSLVYRDASTYTGVTPGIPGPPIKVKLPRALIKQIGHMVEDQNKIQEVVKKITEETEKIAKPIGSVDGLKKPDGSLALNP